MLRLLIVDDEEIIRESLSSSIDYGEMGFKFIGAAKNGMEALGIIQDEYPDVIITDLKMPVMGGLELIERTLKFDKNVEFVILSGYGEFEFAREAMKHGVRYYLTKPTKLNEFKSVLKEIKEKITAAQEEEAYESERLSNALERNFIIESVEFIDKYEEVYRKYSETGIFKFNGITIIYIHFIEENCRLQAFAALKKFLSEKACKLCMPTIYVKNTLILFTGQINNEEKFIQGIYDNLKDISTVGCEITFETSLDKEKVLKNMINKISRYKSIFINFFDSDNFLEIGNRFFVSATSMAEILEDRNNNEREEVLEKEFEKDRDLDELKVFCINVYLQMKEKNTINGMTFFKNVYLCEDRKSLLDLMKNLPDFNPDNEREEIRRLKEYVDLNINSETLSLKWIAQNVLFINVDYLSKLFVKEERMRFSEYINSKRMELAIQLLHRKGDENIKDIANQVGFGNNPGYFSQVFKKYTGITPGEYMENRQR